MADEKSTILIDVQIEGGEAIARQQALKQSLDDVKSKLKEAKESAGTMSEEYIKLEAEAASLNQQLRSNGTVLKQMASNTSDAAGAYAALNKRAADAAQLAKDYAIAYGTADARTKEAVASAKAMSDQLKSVDASVGQTTRSVGDYGIAAQRLPGIFGEMQDKGQAVFVTLRDKLATMKDATMSAVEGFKNQREAMAKMMQDMEKAAIAEQALKDAQAAGAATSEMVTAAEEARAVATTSAAAATNASSVALKLFRAALISTGVGAIVVLFGTLIAALSDFAPVVDRVQQAFAALGAAWKVLKDGIIGLVTGQKSLTESFNGMGKAMSDAAKQAAAWKKVQQDLEDVEMDAEVRNKRAETQIQRLMLMSKNRTLSEKERIAMLQQAQDIEEDINKRNMAINERKIQIALAGIVNGRNFTKAELERLKVEGVAYAKALQDKKGISDKEIEEYQKALIKREDITQQSIALQEKANNRIDQMAEAAQKKEEERIKKAQEAREKAEAKRAADQAKADEAAKKAEEVRLAQLKKNADDALAALDNEMQMKKLRWDEENAGKVKSLEEQNTDAITRITDAYNAQEAALNIKLQNQQITQAQYDEQKKLAAQQLLTDLALQEAQYEADAAQRKADKEALELQAEAELQQLKFQNQYDAQQAQLDAEYAQKIAAANKLGADTVAIEQAYKIASDKIAKAKADAQLAVAGDMAGKLVAIFGKSTVAGKAAATAQVAIDTYKGAMSAWAAAQVYAPPFNTIIGAASVATTVAAGIKAAKDIWAVPVPGGGGAGGGGATISATAAAPSSVTGSLASRNSGQTEQQSTQQAMSNALEAQPQKTVLVTNDVTVANTEKVQLKNDNAL